MAEDTKSPVKYTPPLFSRMSDEQRKQLGISMSVVLALHRPGDSRPHDGNWATYWAKEFLRALEETKPINMPQLSPMICGCAQGAHEERQNTGVVSIAQHNAMTFCRLGWPIK